MFSLTSCPEASLNETIYRCPESRLVKGKDSAPSIMLCGLPTVPSSSIRVKVQPKINFKIVIFAEKRQPTLKMIHAISKIISDSTMAIGWLETGDLSKGCWLQVYCLKRAIIGSIRNVKNNAWQL